MRKFSIKSSKEKSNPWETKEWKERRDVLLQRTDKCEWCESKVGPLSIHHVWGDKQASSWALREMDLVQNKLYNKEVLKGNFKYLVKKICPKCSYRQIRKRAIIKPEFICNRCKFEFDIPKIENFVPDWEDRSRIRKIINTNHLEEVRTAGVKSRQKYYQRYIEIRNDDIAVICKRCHFFWSKQRKIFCGVCHQNLTTGQVKITLPGGITFQVHGTPEQRDDDQWSMELGTCGECVSISAPQRQANNNGPKSANQVNQAEQAKQTRVNLIQPQGKFAPQNKLAPQNKASQNEIIPKDPGSNSLREDYLDLKIDGGLFQG
jgi:hypothetical protein